MKKSDIPHESDIDFEMGNAIGLHDVRRLKALIKKGWPIPDSCVVYAYNLGYHDLLPLLFAAGANPNVKLIHRVPSKWATMVGNCIRDGNIPTLKMLLEHGADPNLPSNGARPIVLAAVWGNPKILRLLIKSGARLFDDPRTAQQALVEAMIRKRIEIVRFLLEHGVSFKRRTHLGKTALQLAKENKLTEILDLFRSYMSAKRAA
jgi:ankyrin repeat protein